MGRRSKAQQRADDSEDTASLVSSSTLTTCRSECTETERQDGFSEAVDNLFEKRGSTREKALAALLGFLRESVRQEEAMQNQATIIGRCVNGIRRGSNVEAVLGSQLLGMLLLTLPEPSESQFREAQSDLYRAAKSGEASEVRTAAADSLAMCCFVAAEDDECCLEVMSQLASLWSGDTRTVAAALRGWAFLFTRLNNMLCSAEVESLLGRLAKLLHASDVEVRGAAGEVLALLYHCCNLRSLLQRYAAMEEAEEAAGGGSEQDEEEAGMDEMGDGGQESQGQLGEVVTRLRQLAAAHHGAAQPLRQSRRDKATQRAAFRGILNVVEAGRVPTTKVKLQGDVLVVDTMEGTIMLAAVKKFLAGGFQVHLQANPQLHAWFDFEPRNSTPARLSALEKRHTRSPSSVDSKWRTSERKGARAYKASRHAPVHEDDY